MGNEIVRVEAQVEALRGALSQRQASYLAALPQTLGIHWDYFEQGVCAAFMKNPDLFTGTPDSQLSCIAQAARLGLSLDPGQHQAYLTVRSNKQKNGTYLKEVQIGLEYGAWVDLLYRVGIIVRTDAIYDKDFFEYSQGVPQFLNHKPAKNPRGKVVGSFCIATYPDGRETFVVVDETDLEYAKSKSPSGSKGFGFWIDRPAEAAKKTAILRVVKTIPRSIERLVAIAAHLDNCAAAGKRQPLLDVEKNNYDVVDVGDYTDDAPQLEDKSSLLAAFDPKRVEDWCLANGVDFEKRTPEDEKRCFEALSRKR